MGIPYRTHDEVAALYESWLVHHGKAYNAIGEKERRCEIFGDNLRFIDEHNRESRSYKVGLTRFADLTNDEYRAMFLGGRFSPMPRLSAAKSSRYATAVGDDLPDHVDWRKKGAVTAVKDQGQCEQELVDCDRTYNMGCNGGLMDYAFQFIIDNGGIDTEKDYPYKASDDTCILDRKHIKVVEIDGYEDLPEIDERLLKTAVADNLCLCIIPGVFTRYCGTDLDHDILAVGYGREDDLDYWIVKNSWEEKWGENGYIKLERNVANSTSGKCGIALQASYPIKTGKNPPKPPPP
ncbi:putative cysteine protease RD21B, partial [Cucurbita argyrosperma subsp. sororia]